jgi:tetratricopeptide (TPR) repeat protein
VKKLRRRVGRRTGRRRAAPGARSAAARAPDGEAWSPAGLVELAEVCFKKGEREKAEACLRTARTLARKRAGESTQLLAKGWMEAGEAAYLEGRYTTAGRCFGYALEAQPSGGAFLWFGRTLEKLGQVARAKEAYREAARDPASAGEAAAVLRNLLLAEELLGRVNWRAATLQ